MVYDRSMKMDGPCALDRCMTDGTENVEFFLDFFFGCIIFDTCSVYLNPSINIIGINIESQLASQCSWYLHS